MPSGPSRKRFALTGRSRPFDPLTTAARPDIADIRLADHIFAPHYAAPLVRTVVAAAAVTADRLGAQAVATVAPGDSFEVLEITAAQAWGVARGNGTVGYVTLTALAAR
ncbi:MAG: SH3 domain-containing protein [Pseudomonadota bacterium]